jgi:ubiquinone/menaquinone biosynthesis C-methylase UbiE
VTIERPVAIRTSPAQIEFEAAARAAGYDPENKWVGGYADYEWDHLRPLLNNYGLQMPRARVLEFGCNVGASTVVMAALGAQVTAIDVAQEMVRIACANVDRHGLKADIRHIADTRTLPFDDGAFDIVIANSVLEYVTPDHLDPIMAELHRVTTKRAQMLICGTASRLSPREVHSGRWFVNFLPRPLDPLLYGRANAQRGLSPLRLARTLKGRFADVTGKNWKTARVAIHGELSPAVKVVMLAAGIVGVSPGWLSPNIELLARRI